MDMQDIEKDIRNRKQGIGTLEDILVTRREGLAHAETQLADAIAAESEKPELEEGDYGKVVKIGWVYIGGKVYWEDGTISGWHDTGFTKYRKGNIFREMEE